MDIYTVFMDQKTQVSLKKKRKVKGFILPEFKIY